MEIGNSERGIQFSGGMPQFLPSARMPHSSGVDLTISDARHMQIGGAPVSPLAENPGKGFGDFLANAVNQVESVDAKSRALSAKSIFDPDSVEVHEVMIAAEKGRFALNLTKTVADGLVRTFRELTQPR
jgi:flagellar hook-basal body complex protein FliE